MKCTPKNLIRDSILLKKYDSVPGMGYKEELIKFLETCGFKSIKGIGHLEKARKDDKVKLSQLHFVAMKTFRDANDRELLYKKNLEKAISDWCLDDSDTKIILNIRDELKIGYDRNELETKLYMQLKHLHKYPLKELFEVISKN